MRHDRFLYAFGAFLIVCGFVGWAATGFEDRARTAILSGGASGLMMMAMGLLAGWPKENMARAGRYGGAFFALAFGAVFAWRAAVAFQAVQQGEPKGALAALLLIMAAASFTAFGRLIRRPAAPAASTVDR